MHFTGAAVLGLLPALSLATPFPQNAGNSPGSNMCDASTFNNGKTYNIQQAPVSDCRALIASVDRQATFSLNHSWARPYTKNQCAFSVRVIAGSKPGLVGGADIVDLVTDSIKNFQESGKISCRGQYGQVVSAEGEVDCNALGGDRVRVEWILASSAYNPPN
ncbi:uncharacterized protein MYCFIDRAFT_52972 [Pseudocercospora fijiensis CIRAD86]|uniref:Ecp2 effector protein-like domain-containing protein n=1 Tax=Pseudocercospora fijiensis (strain CIRAD86) TaxID=383855 RepID=M2Z6V3_PSEFD|nr:uncharacterized protein MYCFIDRAFT_52972 [Pseudocercospora fijiensis CIRAD86]EME85515.1 hypothetical protein MYCFIDRAFT_52972 [Pseudocercospora fijiensis CIRAD86]